MTDKKLSEFDAVSTGDVSYFPVLDGNTKNAKIAATKAMPWTNCITDIPRDIKLSLNNGTLTLQAGSKVYVPNGAGVFDTVTVPSDVVFHTGTVGSLSGTFMIFCNSSGGFGIRTGTTVCASGATNPGSGYYAWYDTTNNKIKYSSNADGNFDAGGYSLPIGIYVRTNGVATSIDKVFNGFGYIGSTVFALPGVKGLIPNGRNEDGTLNSIEFTTTDLRTNTSIAGLSRVFGLGSTSFGRNIDYFYSDDNYNHINTISGTIVEEVPVIDVYADSSNKITNFTLKTVFHAVDYSEFKQLHSDVNNKVDLTTSQIINGQKTTTASQGWKVNNPNVTVGTAPSSTSWMTLLLSGDKNGSHYAQVGSSVDSSGKTGIYLQAYDETATTQNSGTLNIYIEPNGTTYATAPTPNAVTDNSTKIATTQWFNNKIQVVSALPANPVDGVFYFITD